MMLIVTAILAIPFASPNFAEDPPEDVVTNSDDMDGDDNQDVAAM